jgi:Nucleotide-binding C-terminal domain
MLLQRQALHAIQQLATHTDSDQGGITSSDAASKSLNMIRAEIAGQAASGVPLWRCHEKTSKYPGIRESDSLEAMVNELTAISIRSVSRKCRPAGDLARPSG